LINSGSCGLKVNRRGLASAILFQIVRNTLALFERLHTGTFNGGDVNERVAVASLRGDEAVTFNGIEELAVLS